MTTTYIVFDTETSGAFPIGSEVVELGAIKYQDGHQIDELQLLFKPFRPVPDQIVAIHGITNDQLEGVPTFIEQKQKVADFLKADYFVAHHAPFDLGFMAYTFEQAGLALPSGRGLCTSLLARKLIHGVKNHRLQTLVEHFSFDGGQAHRALDDAKSCSALFTELIKASRQASFSELEYLQGHLLPWSRFSLEKLDASWLPQLRQAIINSKPIEISYKKGQLRKVTPLGVVRSPLDGDYIPAWCHIDNKRKRFMIHEISNWKWD